MYGIYRYNLNISKKINSASINAVAQDNKSDALVSLGALVGILGTQIGINWLDSVAALLVGIIICKTAWSIFRDSSYSLTDGFDEQLLQTIGETISKTPGVKEMSEIKARMHGNQILVESTIHVDSTLSILEGHHITEKVEENLSKQHNIKQAIIHVEPFTK